MKNNWIGDLSRVALFQEDRASNIFATIVKAEFEAEIIFIYFLVFLAL